MDAFGRITLGQNVAWKSRVAWCDGIGNRDSDDLGRASDSLPGGLLCFLLPRSRIILDEAEAVRNNHPVRQKSSRLRVVKCFVDGLRS